MTFRKALGGDVRRLHDLLDGFLDREDFVVLLFDGHRAVNYIGGFGLSPSQHELMALAIERMVRAAGVTGASEGMEGGTNMKRPAVLAVALALMSVWVVLAAGVTAVWLTEEVRVVGLAMLPAAIVALLLVLYFDWRGRLMRRVRSERGAHENLDKAA